MNTTLDFQARLTSITKILNIGEATTAATEAVKLIEQALRQVVSRYLDQVTDKVRQDVQEAVKKRVRGDGGIEKLTMGQMVYTLRDAKFLEDWARLTGKSLSSLNVIDLEKLTQLRNKIMHDGAEATRTEAEFLLQALKMILEVFGLMTFAEPAPPNPAQDSQSQPQPAGDLHARIMDYLKSVPTLADENGQRAFIIAAGLDAALREQMRFNLPVVEFVPVLLATLLDYGELQDGRHALRAVLETSKQYVGRDRQAACEKLMQELSNYASSELVGNGRPQSKPVSTTQREKQTSPAVTEKPQNTAQISGGINISNISGRVAFGVVGGSHQGSNIAADTIVGDIISGSTIVREATAGGITAITHGFKQNADKTAFLEQIEALRAALREIRNALSALDGLDEDRKDEFTIAVAQHVNELRVVKEEAEAIPSGKEAPQEKADLVGKYLDQTAALLEKLDKIGVNIAPIGKAQPLLANIRRLFGLS